MGVVIVVARLLRAVLVLLAGIAAENLAQSTGFGMFRRKLLVSRGGHDERIVPGAICWVCRQSPTAERSKIGRGRNSSAYIDPGGIRCVVELGRAPMWLVDDTV
jgi:hypothetical protein